MSPGRAWSGGTICRPFWCCWAFWTQVETAAQPLPGILWPACSSDQVTKEAHHGLPGDTPAAPRQWATCGPVLDEPLSRTPFWLWAICSAAAPHGPPPPAVAAAGASAVAPPPAPRGGGGGP